MRKILNLTQHNTTKEQIEAGVFEPSQKDKEIIKNLLTFVEIPILDDIQKRAKEIALIASKYKVEKAMIGGAPYLMGTLEKALIEMGVTPVYAFSKRVVEEIHNPDGSVEKKAIFKHEGFIEVR